MTAELFRHYQSKPNAYDEVFSAGSALRGHWQRFLANLDRIGNDELVRRWDQSRQIVRENGISFSPYGDPEDKPRPWELDAIPLLIPQCEWTPVADGLKQRARLLERILRDLFGPQTLVSQGLLPPEILFLHPGFRRPYHGIEPSGDRYLHFYAADLARAQDGRWWVLADRTEAPSGSGFALENRVVMSRMLPACFREMNVRRLAPYFMALQENVRRLAPKHRDNPRIVLLSQGAASDNYFEDAYLARYLGYTLVEGGDLTVRRNEVMVKTLGGLLPVDVLVRRPNSEACDPLELEGHQNLGSAGMLQVVRSGSLAVVNPFGSGLIESPIFMAFLPALCERLLGEPLLLPGVATWWCGQEAARQYVLKHLDTLVVKPAFRQRGHGHQAMRELSSLGADKLARLIQANPKLYIAQERIDRSSMPLWKYGEFESSFVALRTYLVPRDDDEYVVMDGGLARTSSLTASLEVSLVSGEGSKDTWVLDDQPVEQVTLLPPSGDRLRPVRSSADLPSRVADNIYWLGRHLERADSSARLVRTVTLRISSETGVGRTPDLPFLVRYMAEQGQIEPGFAVAEIRNRLPAIEQILPAAVFDPNIQGGLRYVINQTHRIASSVRDRLSVDSWRTISHLAANFDKYRGRLDLSDLLNLTNDLITDLAAFGGIITESMTRTHIYRFLELGRRLERAMQIVMATQSCFLEASNIPWELLESILELADIRMTYRSRYLANLQITPVLDLLLTDETNPRSLAYQLAALLDHVNKLPQNSDSPNYSPSQRLAMTMLHAVRMVDIEAMCDAYSLGDQEPLRKLLADLSEQLPQLSNGVSLRYLVHAGPSQQLGELSPQSK